MQNIHVYTPGWAGADQLLEVISLNGGDCVFHEGWADATLMQGHERIIVVSRDPISAILRAYSQEGYEKALSPAIFGQRLVRYCEDAHFNLGKIKSIDDGITARTLYTEDHTQARHWAQSLGAQDYPVTRHTTITIPNSDELRTLCERDLVKTITEYKSVI